MKFKIWGFLTTIKIHVVVFLVVTPFSVVERC